jgi:hypothetical protein
LVGDTGHKAFVAARSAEARDRKLLAESSSREVRARAIRVMRLPMKAQPTRMRRLMREAGNFSKRWDREVRHIAPFGAHFRRASEPRRCPLENLSPNKSALLHAQQADLQKVQERQAIEQRKKDDELREAKRQQQRLNFLLTQTELYTHFMGKDSANKDTDTADAADGVAAVAPSNPDFTALGEGAEEHEAAAAAAKAVRFRFRFRAVQAVSVDARLERRGVVPSDTQRGTPVPPCTCHRALECRVAARAGCPATGSYVALADPGTKDPGRVSGKTGRVSKRHFDLLGALVPAKTWQ